MKSERCGSLALSAYLPPILSLTHHRSSGLPIPVDPRVSWKLRQREIVRTCSFCPACLSPNHS